MRKKWLFAVATGAGLLFAVGIGAAVLAQEGGNGSGPSFIERVAGKLGVSADALGDAIRGARKDEIDDAVARGDLTREQADRLKERIDELPEDFPFGPGLPHGGPGFGFEFRSGDGDVFPLHFFGPGFGPGEAQEKLAGYLGITPEQLRTELTDGCKSLAEIAGAHGKTRDDLLTFLRAELSARLGQAVADGKLTQEQADHIGERVGAAVEHIVDIRLPMCGGEPFRPHFRGHWFGEPMPGMPPDEPAPGATPSGENSLRVS